MTHRQQQQTADASALKIQNAYRHHRAQTLLKDKATWQIHEKLEYSSEQTESRLRQLFDKLINSSESLSPSVTKILQKITLPRDEQKLLQSTNPDLISVDANYRGPRIESHITRQTFVDLIEAFRTGQVLHERYVCKILHQARSILKTLPNINHIDLAHLHHIFVIGDLHGQLADLLYIFNENGIPSADNAYLFNGDFVDRGKNSVEVFLLLMVALILNPSSLFLNRGNHEDYMVNLRYGFQQEVGKKYKTFKEPLLDLFNDIFSWIPLYSVIQTGTCSVMVVHGGISDRLHLSQINKLARNRYVTIGVQPAPKTPGDRLTKQEKDEYHQVEDLLWSDPDPKGGRGCRENKDRGTSCFFGPDVTQEFLNKHKFSMIIRSHQVKQQGFEYKHNDKLITLFSASNYSGGSNWGAIIRWDYNAEHPKIITYTTKPADLQKRHFSKQVSLLEDPVYQSLVDKIISNKSLLQKEFAKADKAGTNHLPLLVWSNIMTNVLEIELPWLTLRSKLVQEDSRGILYNSMFDEYILKNEKFQQSNSGIMDDLYRWKDMLTVLFNLIDQNHSGFINRDELADVVKLLLQNEDENDFIGDANIDEICSTMDINHDGKIDINEFLESYRLVCTKT